MEHVIVRREPHGYWLDPLPYLEILPNFSDRLPPGAKAFAEDPSHYDFSSARCVKDLWLRSLLVDDADGSISLIFGPNQFKHDVGLRLNYTGAAGITVHLERRTHVLGWQLMLDELLPARPGITHQLAFDGGSITVDAEDVAAKWG
jgi:hypothetical protein